MTSSVFPYLYLTILNIRKKKTKMRVQEGHFFYIATIFPTTQVWKTKTPIEAYKFMEITVFSELQLIHWIIG